MRVSGFGGYFSWKFRNNPITMPQSSGVFLAAYERILLRLLQVSFALYLSNKPEQFPGDTPNFNYGPLEIGTKPIAAPKSVPRLPINSDKAEAWH